MNSHLFYCAHAIFLMLLHARICWQIFFIYIGVFFLSNLGDCWECAQHDYGWSVLGGVVGTVIILIFAKIKCMFLNINL